MPTVSVDVLDVDRGESRQLRGQIVVARRQRADAIVAVFLA